MSGSVSIGELHGTVSLEDRFSNAFRVASGVVNGALDSMEGKFKSIAVIGGTVAGAIVGIGGTIAALAVKGSHLNDLDRGFQKLAGSVENADAIMRAMERGTAKTVDSTKLLEFANRALQTGSIKTAQGFETVTSAARVLSRQGLGSIESVMGTVNNALATGRTRQLQFLVGSIDLKAAEEKYAKSLGVTRDQLSAAGKLAADRIAIMERLSQTVKNAGTVETSFAEKITAARLAIGNWFDDVAKAVAKSPEVNKAFDAIGDALVRNFGGGATTVAEALVRWINKFAEMTAHYAPIVIDWIRRMYDWVVSMWQAVKKAWDQVPDWLKDIAKEALLAGVAFKATDVALGAIGGGDILGKLGSIGGAVSGLRDVFLSLIELKIVLWAKEWMQMFLVFKWDAVILAVRSIGAAVMAWAGWPVATVLLMGTALYKMWTQWKEGETMWEFFSKGGGFWDNSMIGEWLGMSKAVDKTAESIERLRKAGVGLMRDTKPKGSEFMLTSRQGGGTTPPPDGGDIDLQSRAKAVADATNASIDQTAQRWREYFQELDKLSADTLDKQLREIDRWYEAERSALDKTKKNSADYQNNLTALDEQFRAKQLVTTELYNRRLAEDTANAAMEQQKIWEAKQEKQLAIDEAGYQALVRANDEYADMVKKSAMSTAEYQIEQVDRWLQAQILAWPIGAKGFEDYYKAIKASSDRMKDMSGNVMGDDGQILSGADYEAGRQMINPNAGLKAGRAFREGFARALQGFPQLLIDSLTGGGGVLNAFKALGANITNSLFGEGGTLSQVTQRLSSTLGGFLSKGLGTALGGALGSAISSLLPGIGGLVAPLVDKIVSFFKGIGGPSKQELEGRDKVKEFESQFASVEEMINRVGDAYADLGMTREQAQADVAAIWAAEKLGAEATAEAIKKVEDALKRVSEIDAAISSLGIKSQEELMHAAEIANAAYEKIAAGVESGKYTAEDAAKAYRAYQEALAAAGDAAAKAWLEANDSITDFDKAVEQAGYKTTAELQKSADKARQLWEYMRDSGKYAAEDVEDAFKKAEEAQLRAMGLSQKLLDRRKSLMESIGKEADEKEKGSIQKQEEAELDRIEQQMKEAMEKAGKQAETAADKTKDAFEGAARDAQRGFVNAGIAAGESFKRVGADVFNYWRELFQKLHPEKYEGGERAPSTLPVPPPGGYRTPQHLVFAEETDVAPDSFVGSAAAGPQTITVRVPIDGRTLTEVTLDRLESGEYEQRSSELVGRLVRRR